jgi:hypothetical protein
MSKFSADLLQKYLKKNERHNFFKHTTYGNYWIPIKPKLESTVEIVICYAVPEQAIFEKQTWHTTNGYFINFDAIFPRLMK